MTYSTDLRILALNYLKTHSYREAWEVFRLPATTLQRWERLQRTNGTPAMHSTYQRQPSKYPSEALNDYVRQHPSALLEEVAEHFGGSRSGAWAALHRIGFDIKKEHQLMHGKNVPMK